MSVRPGILVASPDRGIQRLLRRLFETAGYTITTADTGVTTLAAIKRTEPDLVILSTELPDLAADKLIARVRAAAPVPIIALLYPGGTWSARQLLDLGADDCVSEPFLVQEFAARVRRLLSRSGVWVQPKSVPTALGSINIDPLARTARLGGQPLELSNREFELLLVLLSAAGSPVPHDDVLQRIWGKGSLAGRQNLRRVVSSLRARLESDPEQPALLLNVRGLGYRLVVSGAAVAESFAEPAA